MNTKPIALMTDEGREIHVPHPGGGDYLTLCGMDGHDAAIGQHGTVPCGVHEAVTCAQCWQIFAGVKAMRGLRFEV